MARSAAVRAAKLQANSCENDTQLFHEALSRLRDFGGTLCPVRNTTLPKFTPDDLINVVRLFRFVYRNSTLAEKRFDEWEQADKLPRAMKYFCGEVLAKYPSARTERMSEALFG